MTTLPDAITESGPDTLIRELIVAHAPFTAATIITVADAATCCTEANERWMRLLNGITDQTTRAMLTAVVAKELERREGKAVSEPTTEPAKPKRSRKAANPDQLARVEMVADFTGHNTVGCNLGPAVSVTIDAKTDPLDKLAEEFARRTFLREKVKQYTDELKDCEYDIRNQMKAMVGA